MISLTLLYATLMPLVLQLVLGIWYTSPEPLHPASEWDLATTFYLSGMLPEAIREALAGWLAALSVAWYRSDQIWIGTKLLGGMSAGFGLRVILPTRPLETTAIVLAGWLAADAANRMISLHP